jgi:hypothetical protein
MRIGRIYKLKTFNFMSEEENKVENTDSENTENVEKENSVDGADQGEDSPSDAGENQEEASQ